MKIHQFLTICLAFALSSCGGGDDDAGSAQAPPKKASPPVEANETAKKAALDRIETMKKITVVLKPLRDADAALAKEGELNTLFAEYNGLTAVAKTEGVSGAQLARLTAQLAPGDWADTRAEFQQYMLLVRQLGEPQRDMMERLMKATPTKATPEPAG